MNPTTSTPELELPIRTKVAILATKIARKATKFASKTMHPVVAMTNALGLGLLNKERIEQLVKYSYVTNPDFYNPGKYDYQWEEDIITPLNETTTYRNLLVAFCGKGREAEIFSNHGYNVTGIDREAFMIEDAIKFSKEKGYNANFECVNFDDYIADTPYDIVYTSTWMYTTYLSREDRSGFLKKCKELCSKNGVIVISYCIRKDDFLDTLLHLIVKAVALLSFGNRKAIKGDRIERGLFWHYFTKTEIERELEAAGMETTFHLSSNTKDWEWRFIRPVNEKQPSPRK